VILDLKKECYFLLTSVRGHVSMETSCKTMRIEMMFIRQTERLLSCVPVCEIPLFSPLPTTTTLLSADNVTRGTSEIDTNCRSSLGRHLQTILTRLYILLLVLQLEIFMSVSQFCACLFTPFCLHCFIVHTLRFGWGWL